MRNQADRYTLLQLSNGLQVLHLSQPDARAEYCGVAVGVGSRDESAKYAGLAHFVEHTIFKGTTKRSARRIINRMESVGGELNAYTTKEETFVYSVFPRTHIGRAMDLIANLVIDSQFPTDEIDREREVIAEEIDSYLDNPAESVFDEFDELIFRGTPLAHNILGTEQSISTITSDVCRDFLSQFYRADNMVLFYAGSASSARIAAMADRYFSALQSGSEPSRPTNNAITLNPILGRTRRADADTHQAHTILGALTPSLHSPQRHAIALFNNIIGGPGMNSLLNLELREKRGLVYTVDSSTTLYNDCGQMTVYYGCARENVDRCTDIINRIITRLAAQPLSESRLSAVKRQLLGQMTIASASTENMILPAARSVLWRKKFTSNDEARKAIMAVTADELITVAQMMLPAKTTTLTLG